MLLWGRGWLTLLWVVGGWGGWWVGRGWRVNWEGVESELCEYCRRMLSQIQCDWFALTRNHHISHSWPQIGLEPLPHSKVCLLTGQIRYWLSHGAVCNSLCGKKVYFYIATSMMPMFPGLSDHWPIRRCNTWLFDRPTNQMPCFIWMNWKISKRTS